jgi:hypothetical protein
MPDDDQHRSKHAVLKEIKMCCVRRNSVYLYTDHAFSAQIEGTLKEGKFFKQTKDVSTGNACSLGHAYARKKNLILLSSVQTTE